MKYIKNTDIYIENGKALAPGDRVLCNENDKLYEGLYGTIEQILTGEDKETENATADIYVNFEEPTSLNFKHAVKKRFTDGNDDISLDSVIMAAEMLDVQVVGTVKQVFVVRVVENVVNSFVQHTDSTCFTSEEDAFVYFNKQVALLKNVCREWFKSEEVIENFRDDLYTASALKNPGFYIQVTVEVAQLNIDGISKMRLAHEYEADCRIEDVLNRLEDRADPTEYQPITKEDYERLSDDAPRIAKLFNEALEKNDRYWESFWSSLDFIIDNEIEM